MAEERFGDYLSRLIRQKGYTMRQLAIESGVHPSLVSRVLAGKRQPTVDFLWRVSRPLGADPQHLLLAAGKADRLPTSDLATGSTSAGAGEEARHFVPYLHYAQTEEGEAEILERFNRSLKRLERDSAGPVAELKDRLWSLFRLFRGHELAAYARSLAGGALLYFISPVDLVPDYLPLVGFLDDVAVVAMVWSVIQGSGPMGEKPDSNSLAQN